MKQNIHSLTAHKVAMMRAAHQLFDDPTIFNDPMALSIIGTQGVSEIRAEEQKYKTRLHSRLRAIVVARSKFVEDELSDAVERGTRQYVILGAGLDTFAYRNPYSAGELNIFEVDYPATQVWKRRRLNTARIPLPGNVTFVPIDFENQSLAGRLRDAGFREDVPSFFSLLGVTMYLTRETIMETMTYIASSVPSSSHIVFDYTIPPSSQPWLSRLVFYLLARKIATIGEPWESFYDPKLLMMDLASIGFTQAKDLSPEEMNERFFKHRSDHLMVGHFGHLMTAGI